MNAGKQLAARIQDDIEAKGISNGALIGSEGDLCGRYDVTPAVLRQASRILEARDVAVMKRGISGGLYVREMSLEAVANYIATQWEIENVQIDQLLPGQAALQQLTVHLASKYMTVSDGERLRALQQICRNTADPIERSFHALERDSFIDGLTRNPFIMLCSAVLIRFMRNTTPFEYLSLHIANQPDLTDMKVEALIAADIGVAQRAAVDYLRNVIEHFCSWEGSTERVGRDAILESSLTSMSRPIWVARQILRDIRGGQWPVGALLGTEAELLQRFKVGRGTWRQALRVLEEYSAVETRRGIGGGVYVASPDPTRAKQMAQTWLKKQGATSADAAEVIEALSLPQVHKLWSDNRSDDISDRLGTCRFDSMEELLSQIASKSGCPMLGLLTMSVPQWSSDWGWAPLHFSESAAADMALYLRNEDTAFARRALQMMFTQWKNSILRS